MAARLLSIARYAVAGVLLPVLTLAAGIGSLYLLYRSGLLAMGPHVPRALALEQLAGHDGQPLGRVLAAWLSVGAASGLVLAALGARHPGRLLAAFTVGSAIVILATGAFSDALANNQQLVDHLSPQLTSRANLLEWDLSIIGAALTLWLSTTVRPLARFAHPQRSKGVSS